MMKTSKAMIVWSLLVSAFFATFAVTTTAAAAASVDTDAPDDAVTCGSVIKLTHVESSAAAATKSGSFYNLNSEAKNLGSGSGQQIVTAVDNPTSLDTLWWVREPSDPPSRGNDAACSGGTASPIKCGQIIRLTHLETMRNLHSHNVKSPLSRQQEVSGYGAGDGLGDNGDDWRVVCSTSGVTYWRREAKVYLQHVDSTKYLGASSTVKFTQQNCGHNCPIMNHEEVFARSSLDKYGLWFVESGVHIHR
ncbi:MIR domain containing protein [Nitzschia inconspicua]|uniref:MIR domain containing protein n=1 Tax=Nitzschia inconspicua TaxID=303405 RepID=A0A9K3KRU2_9STRA|nr:MIR domain containing protein [Nitzschia inconspicua]